ncbi:P-loop containing nucleoside triphosphate hydrolase protein [Mycena floridula]|nr:P-loop containing nucleoside triphosphate hydrolase protein [Mycena floridula]
MMDGICGDVGLLDLWDSCIRESWAAIIPLLLVFALSIPAFRIRLPDSFKKVFIATKSNFTPFLSLHEAEALDLDAANSAHDDDSEQRIFVAEVVPLWRTIIFALLGLTEALFWFAIGSYNLITDETSSWPGIRAFLIALVWLYTVVRPVIYPSATVSIGLFATYCMQLLAGMVQFGGAFFAHTVQGDPLPSGPTLGAYTANLVIILVLLIVTLSMPLNLPSSRVSPADIGKTVNPEYYTSLWGWATFSWVYPLIKKGRDMTLHEDDVWNMSTAIQSRPTLLKFNTIKRSTLLRRLWTENSLDISLDIILCNLGILVGYSSPYFLKQILDSIDKTDATDADRSKAYLYACLMLLGGFTKTQVTIQQMWYVRRASVRLRTTLMAAIYEKALKRRDLSGSIDKDKASPTPNHNTANPKVGQQAGADVGKIVNLMASDANRIATSAAAMYFLYGAPLQIVLGCTFLYKIMGFSAFSGFLVLAVASPFTSYLARRSLEIGKGGMIARDKRMGVLDEILKAAKFIKFFAWEDRWIQRALDAREVELGWMVKTRWNSIMFYFLWNLSPIMVSVVSFLVYVLMGNQLTIGIAFTAITLFGMLRAPLNGVPDWIVQVIHTGIAIDRIAVFLEEEEVAEQVSSLKRDLSHQQELPGPTSLGLNNATLKWNQVEDSNFIADSAGDAPDNPQFELRDISVSFPEGKLSVVTGPTASGKTALLMAILGEMTLLEGNIVMDKNPSRVDEFGLTHCISYVSQTPWLRNQSIKDNILFGYPFDKQRYEDVLECCALNPDLNVLEDGDETEIGAGGISLSGGQKARVALARAVYARTQFVLVDDPLSAVDSHTSRFLYEKLLCGPLLANRTVVLVTHHIDLVMPSAHYLVRMLDGRIDAQGTVAELRERGILDQIVHDAAAEVEQEMDTSTVATIAETLSDLKRKPPRKLVEDERREEGGVKWSIYKTYVKAFSYRIWGFLIFLVFLTQLVVVGERLWIMIWGGAYTQDTTLTSWLFTSSIYAEHHLTLGNFHTTGLAFNIRWPDPNQHPFFYVGIFALIGLVRLVINVSSVAAEYTGALRASRILFKQLLVTIVRATFRFHDTTPQGRILNRFGKDIETLDKSLASALKDVNAALAGFFTSIMTVVFIFPLFLIPASALGYVYWSLALLYLETGRDLRRMESNTRSPIFSDFGEVLQGIVTLRAFSAEKRFMDGFHKKVDMTNKMWYMYWMTNRWLLFNFDCMGSLAVYITALLSIHSVTGGAGIAGVCITSALSFTESVYWACRSWTELELSLNSVERVVEYLDVPQEPSALIESNRPPAYWPSNSTDSLIIVEDLTIKYAPDLPAVLHHVSFTLKAGERVGLVGRTGSGKSTLAMSLLRFVDPTSGCVLIDGMDISKIGLYDLRTKLTFIPQDATLFSGSLRDNLDPFSEHDDSECLDVLYRVQMMTRTPETSHETSRAESTNETLEAASTLLDVKTKISLDMPVTSGGSNFSQGQRQLISMARALLKPNSIIILDEATSSIDFETDKAIQKVIREQFGQSLLLTVAHRLQTVIDYDRLIVLDKGVVAEMGTPYDLIRKQEGIFRNMCLNSGSFQKLEGAAEEKAMNGTLQSFELL